MLRQKGVVGKFVEFYGPGLSALPVVDRTTISNMSPEFGSTVAIFPIDDRTLEYLRLTGRSREQIELVEAYAKAQTLFRTDETPDPAFADSLALDLSTVEPRSRRAEPSAGPRASGEVKRSFERAMEEWVAQRDAATTRSSASRTRAAAERRRLRRPTPSSMTERSLLPRLPLARTRRIRRCLSVRVVLARNALARGLRTQPWVKTSLAPGSKVVTDYLEKAGLQELSIGLASMSSVWMHDLHRQLRAASERGRRSGLRPRLDRCGGALRESKLRGTHPRAGSRELSRVTAAGRRLRACRANDVDLTTEPLGTGSDGLPVFLAEIWPSNDEIATTLAACIGQEMFEREYSHVFDGDENWRNLQVATSERYAWDPDSEYVKKPPYFDEMPEQPRALQDVHGARAIAVLGDSVTTDHIRRREASPRLARRRGT